MVDQGRVLGGGELVFCNNEAVGDTGIAAFHFQSGDIGTDMFIPFKVNEFGNAVLDVALEHQAGFGVVAKFISTDFIVQQLIDFVTFEAVVTVAQHG